ncbi:sulfurtransferase TusA family protein [Enterobacteriaceae endosymbiont of Neohaemonia nigricornis]|uniref:sulfurtransferase TusA family protein n=1 Tax=Enterobacteriaceae endosymbiont of Neohaemonia nigricornis TaxID=2675792 RepID=UPI001449B9E1|nr:sulfurtransferase TusA family protein [Enterobacteriaceae endosymbiont of Neohaemonia nigricornis]QJC30236.1 hypothetical protein GJT85_00135 [Enterobacteriaceae endosymbiont of Neohaemonia nigricornis]
MKINKINIIPTYNLNLMHLQCPYTIIKLKKKTDCMQKDDTLLITTNNNIVKLDIISFCNFMNFKIIKKQTNILPYVFLIQK